MSFKYRSFIFIVAIFIESIAFATPDNPIPQKSQLPKGTVEKIAPGQTSNPSVHAAQALITLFTKITSLQTSFEQLTLDAGGKHLQAFTGKLWLQKPLNFYYETNPPHNQVIALKENEVWVYDKDLQQVTVQPFDQQFSQTPVMLIVKPEAEFLQKNFTIKASKRGDSGQQQFELMPLAKDQLYKKIRFHFTQDKLYEIQLEDNIGQKTVMTFYEDAIFNQPIDPKQFQLELPTNVDVLK